MRYREYKDFNDGLYSMSLYKSFCKEIEFKNYRRIGEDPGT